MLALGCGRERARPALLTRHDIGVTFKIWPWHHKNLESMLPRPRAMLKRILTFVLALMASTCVLAEDDSLDDDQQIARLDICYDYGCATRKRVYVFESDWAPVRELLLVSKNALDERERIAAAVGLMEQIIGRMTPTHADLPGNDFDEALPHGQMDCIDESMNTSRYLSLFQDQGLLKWHRVVGRVYRAPIIIDQHWAAQIEERESTRRFAVDSWFRGNGEPAIVQPVGDWRKRTLVASGS